MKKFKPAQRLTTLTSLMTLGVASLSSGIASAQSLRYTYSGGSTTSSSVTNHQSAVHSFGTNFDMYYSITCAVSVYGPKYPSYANLEFYSQTLNRDWEVVSKSNDTSSQVSFSGHYHSDMAQTMVMYFAARQCSYTVNIYQ
jgi:hypothetical protein